MVDTIVSDPQTPPEDALPAGTRLDDYVIEGVLGHGGFGITYRARDTRLNLPVALKECFPRRFVRRDTAGRVVPRQSDNADPFANILERFNREAQTLAACRHRNVVRVLRRLEGNGTAFMVMELLDAVSLEDCLDARSIPLPPGELRSWLLPILDALHELHGQGIYHCDVSPANILITRDGTPMLIDFGSVRCDLPEPGGGPSMPIVSRNYSPPELYHTAPRLLAGPRRRDDIGPWTDIYAVAAIAYRAIAGHPPAEAPERSTAQVTSAPDPYLPLNRMSPAGYSRRLLGAIDAALALARTKRPQSVPELLEWFAPEKPASRHLRHWSARFAAFAGTLAFGVAGPALAISGSVDPLMAAGLSAAAPLALVGPALALGRRLGWRNLAAFAPAVLAAHWLAFADIIGMPQRLTGTAELYLAIQIAAAAVLALTAALWWPIRLVAGRQAGRFLPAAAGLATATAVAALVLDAGLAAWPPGAAALPIPPTVISAVTAGTQTVAAILWAWLLARLAGHAPHQVLHVGA